MSDKNQQLQEISKNVLNALKEIAKTNAILEYELQTNQLGGVGDNLYGLVLQATINPIRTLPTLLPVKPINCILKMAPKNEARRAHTHVEDYYAREVFMYEKVFVEYEKLTKEFCNSKQNIHDIIPCMMAHGLQQKEEFIILQDLTQQQFQSNPRNNMPTVDMVNATLKSLAQLHATSFALQHKKPVIYQQLTAQIFDNLFTENIEDVSIEFAKKYVRRTRNLLEQQTENAEAQSKIQLLQNIENQFKALALSAVKNCAPYAVICHGDFWNNNILYKYNVSLKILLIKKNLLII